MDTLQAGHNTKANWRDRATITIEEAAPILGIGRSTAYILARTGELPTLQLGRRKLVLTARLRVLLGETNEGAAAVGRDDAYEDRGAGHVEDYPLQ